MPAGLNVLMWRKVSSSKLAVLAFLLATIAFPARASDVELRKLLNLQGCTSFSLTETKVLGDTTLFKVNCFGSSHRKLEVICISRSCRLDDSAGELEEGR